MSCHWLQVALDQVADIFTSTDSLLEDSLCQKSLDFGMCCETETHRILFLLSIAGGNLLSPVSVWWKMWIQDMHETTDKDRLKVQILKSHRRRI